MNSQDRLRKTEVNKAMKRLNSRKPNEDSDLMEFMTSKTEEVSKGDKKSKKFTTSITEGVQNWDRKTSSPKKLTTFKAKLDESSDDEAASPASTGLGRPKASVSASKEHKVTISVTIGSLIVNGKSATKTDPPSGKGKSLTFTGTKEDINAALKMTSWVE